jgi:ABC-type Zn uptake system ZnuABC Zn-binding protein ZnuA
MDETRQVGRPARRGRVGPVPRVRLACRFALLGALWLTTAGCSLAPADPGSSVPLVAIDRLSSATLGDQRLAVVATTSIVGDVLSNVGGADIDLRVMVPAGGDPHEFAPAPADLRSVQRAQVVFVSGLGLEQAILPDLAAAGNARLVSISEGIEPLAFGQDAGESSRVQAGAVAATDPHVWMDPANVERWAQNAADALSRLDPASGPEYQERASAYIDRLRELDRWIGEQTQQLDPSQRLLVTDHYTLGYYAQRYQFQVVGAIIPSASSMAEPAPRALADLQDKIRNLSVPAIFVENDLHPASFDTLANDVGAEIVPIYVGALTSATGPAPTYLDLMRTDTRRIVEALSK